MNIVFFIQPGTNSRCTLIDLMRGFENAGHRVIPLELGPVWDVFNRAGQNQAMRAFLVGQFTGMVRKMMADKSVDLSVAMWANALLTLSAAGAAGDDQPRARSLFDLIGQKHLCYWLDAPHWAHEGQIVESADGPLGDLLRSPNIHHAINNSATAEEMRSVFGMKNVIQQPYGIDETVFRPHDVDKEFDIVMALGPGDGPPTRLMLEMLDTDEPDIATVRHEQAELVRRRVMTLADRFGTEADGARRLLEALVHSQLTDRHRPMLGRLRGLLREPACRVAVGVMLSDPRLFVDVTMQVRAMESWERAFTLTYLSRRYRCAVFGGGISGLDGWNADVVRLGPLSWPDQAAAYSRARLGLNVMRWQDDAGLNVKPYEITASGAACLCAQRAGIEDVFEPGREVAVFEGPAQAARLAGQLLADPYRLDEMARAGRARTLRDHTWTSVARDLIVATAA